VILIKSEKRGNPGFGTGMSYLHMAAMSLLGGTMGALDNDAAQRGKFKQLHKPDSGSDGKILRVAVEHHDRTGGLFWMQLELIG